MGDSANKILVVGQGGREHALADALHRSSSAPELLAYPGHAGMADLAPTWPLESAEQLEQQALRDGIKFCVVGPEQYLADGWADRLRGAGIPVWGPGQKSVRLETSKAFAKEFMFRHGIPTGLAQVAHTADELRDLARARPCVLKFDGLAAGKGVAICESDAEVEAFIAEVFEQQRFGAGSVLVEEYLQGPEVSIMTVVSDGAYHCFPAARDYKRQCDGDQGPNTGGMGAVAALDLLDEALLAEIERRLIAPTVAGLVADQMAYRGFLYFGVMLTAQGPKMLEYNCRFGDPEAQAVLPLVEGDFAGFLYQAAQGILEPERIQFASDWSVCVVMATADYPARSGRGQPIQGLDDVATDALVFHAGTQLNEQGEFETNGGRVLAVSARGADRGAAVENAYADLRDIGFDGAQWRSDIGRLHFDAERSAGHDA